MAAECVVVQKAEFQATQEDIVKNISVYVVVVIYADGQGAQHNQLIFVVAAEEIVQ